MSSNFLILKNNTFSAEIDLVSNSDTKWVSDNKFELAPLLEPGSEIESAVIGNDSAINLEEFHFSVNQSVQENETFTEFDFGSGIEDVVTDNKSVPFSGDFDDSTGFEIDTEPYSEFETTTVVSDSGFETTSVSDSNLETDKGVNFWDQ